MSILAILKDQNGSLDETVEVGGSGDQCLSSRLRDMQQQINAKLTTLVEKKRAANGNNQAGSEDEMDTVQEDDDDEEDAPSPTKKRKT